MIKKYKQFKESLLNKLQGPTKEEVWKGMGFGKGFTDCSDFIDYVLQNSEELFSYGWYLYKYKDDMDIFFIEKYDGDYDDIVIANEFYEICNNMFNVNSNYIKKVIFNYLKIIGKI